MRNFRFGSLLIVLLMAACLPVKRSMIKQECQENCLKLHSPFDIQNAVLLYRAKVDFREQHYSGLMLVKSMGEKDLRLVFTNELGLNFFDFELNSNSFTVHHIIDFMDRKRVINTLVKDLSLILQAGYNINSRHYYIDEMNNRYLFCLKTLAGRSCYFADIETGQFERGMRYSPLGRKVATVDFQQYAGRLPAGLTLTHRSIHLNLQLKLLKR